jgi:hypothetical protein
LLPREETVMLLVLVLVHCELDARDAERRRF